MHHNPCFNLFILHSNPFDNQGSEISKNDMFLRFDIYIYKYIYINIKKLLRHSDKSFQVHNTLIYINHMPKTRCAVLELE